MREYTGLIFVRADNGGERVKNCERNRGSATMAALLSLSILLCLGGILARLGKIESDSTINFRDGIAAQCIAEAGLRRALVVLYKNGTADGLMETITRDSFAGSYRIVTSGEGTNLRVRSAGTVGSAKRSASALISMTMQSTPGEPLTELTILSWDK